MIKWIFKPQLKNEIEKFLELYKNLPTTVHNKKQNVIKKRWLKNFNEELERLYFEKEDPLLTSDEEFEGVYELITEYVFPSAFVEAHRKIKKDKEVWGQMSFITLVSHALARL